MAAPRKTRSKVGVIGLGIIGTRVAANLRSAGHQVYVWSRTPRAAPNFLGSVVEVADLCDVIQLFVSDDGALQEITRTVAAALRPRHVVLCHATVSPAATRQAAVIFESQGARYLDAPFTGSKAAAQNRQLVYYVGGAKPALEEARPVLEATSRAILHVGGIGDASVLKIATNMLTASTVQTLAEALALVRAAGIDGSKLVEALENNSSRSGTSDLKLPAMIAANAEPNFSLKHMLKDVRFAQELADEYELSLPVTDTTAAVFALGLENGWGDQDFSVVAQLYPVAAPAGATAEPTLELPPADLPALEMRALETPASAAANPVEPPAVPLADPPASARIETPADPKSAEATPAAEPTKDSSASASVETPTPAEQPKPPAGESGKPPAGESGRLLVPVSKEQLANLLLPPRPGSADPAKPPSPPEPGDGRPAAAPLNQEDGSATGASARAGLVGPVQEPEVVSVNAVSPAVEGHGKESKKNTFRFVRNFFRAEPR